jgi:hypothetical protein
MSAGYSDLVLLASLVYLSIDIQFEWDDFRTCTKPIHKWLLGSYVLVIISRLVCVAGAVLSTTNAGEFLLDLRHKGRMLQVLSHLTWMVIVPGFTIWSALGTSWIVEVRRTPGMCLPSGVHFWFLIVWQGLSYLWIVVHAGLGIAAWVLERRLRKAERDLQMLEHLDSDLQSRWGRVSTLSDYRSLSDLSMSKGLTPAQIASLQGADIAGPTAAELEEECPICLTMLKPGDSVRLLESCGHTFHRSCIDLWLLRRADCPLCKRGVSCEPASVTQENQKERPHRGRNWHV